MLLLLLFLPLMRRYRYRRKGGDTEVPPPFSPSLLLLPCLLRRRKTPSALPLPFPPSTHEWETRMTSHKRRRSEGEGEAKEAADARLRQAGRRTSLFVPRPLVRRSGAVIPPSLFACEFSLFQLSSRDVVITSPIPPPRVRLYLVPPSPPFAEARSAFKVDRSTQQFPISPSSFLPPERGRGLSPN